MIVYMAYPKHILVDRDNEEKTRNGCICYIEFYVDMTILWSISFPDTIYSTKCLCSS